MKNKKLFDESKLFVYEGMTSGDHSFVNIYVAIFISNEKHSASEIWNIAEQLKRWNFLT